jgi:histidyl-tRNA synthetase
MSAGALPGFRDFYPNELAERNHLFGIWRDVARRFGFAEYDGPPLEPLELYTRKSGDEIVGQLYNFTDKGGREVALRPEMTPTFARMVAARANALRKPVRWFSIPQLFRYERQQKGRLREHFQLNVDIVGESDVAADAELLAVAIEIMRGAGLSPEDVVARFSDRRLLAALLRAWGVPDESVPVAYAAIDKLERDPRSVLIDRLRVAGVEPASAERILASAAASDAAALRAELAGDPAVAEALERLDRYLELLRAHGVAEWVRFDLSIVRGLAYYTGIVFELFDRRGEFRAICGGGRYDSLLRDLGGVDLPALGFGMGDVVLTELLRARGRLTPDGAAPHCWVAAQDSAPATKVRVVDVAARLRRAGVATEYALRDQSLSKQLKTAANLGVSFAVLLSPNQSAEMIDQIQLVIRDLRRGSEQNVTVEQLFHAPARYLATDRP